MIPDISFVTRETISASYVPPEIRFVDFIRLSRNGVVYSERRVTEIDRLGFPDAWKEFDENRDPSTLMQEI